MKHPSMLHLHMNTWVSNHSSEPISTQTDPLSSAIKTRHRYTKVKHQKLHTANVMLSLTFMQSYMTDYILYLHHSPAIVSIADDLA